MSANIKFEGFFEAYFKKVEPYEIELLGTMLTIQGRQIPIGDQYLHSAMKVFSRASLCKRCEMTAIVETDGNMQYVSNGSDLTSDYILSKVFSFGDKKNWQRLTPGEVPSKETQINGFYYG